MPLRFTVIGCGRMGKRRIECIRSHPRAQLLSVCDPVEETARAAEKEYAVPCRRDYRAALEDGADAVLVCTPNAFHAPVILEALRRGKHVFCEKPLAPGVEESRKLVEAALARGKTLAVGANLRYFPNVAEALRLFREGEIGELLFARSWIGHNGWNLSTPWYKEPLSAGGGTFLDNGSHALDLLRLFMGELVDCSGMIDTALWTEIPLEDNAIGVFKDARGRMGTVHASWTEWGGYFHMEVYGSRGFLRIGCRKSASVLEWGSAEGKTSLRDFSRLPPDSCAREFAAFLDALAKGVSHKPSGHDGLRCVRMAYGVYESAKTRAHVDLWTPADRELQERVSSWEDSGASPGSTTT